MTSKRNRTPEGEPTQAHVIAGMLMGTATTDMMGATLQRSHRFLAPHLFEMENMATKTKLPTSTLINLVVEAGLEAIRAHLPDELRRELSTQTPEQTKRFVTASPHIAGFVEQLRGQGRTQEK